MSVLYFDHDRALLAYDDITVGGTGLAEVTLSRHVVDDPHRASRRPGHRSPPAHPEPLSRRIGRSSPRQPVRSAPPER